MRLKIINNIILAAFIILACSLFWMQAVRGGYYYNLSQNNRIRLVPLEPTRGKIFDIKGKVIADSVLSYDLVVRPQEIKNKKEKYSVLNRLSSVLGKSVDSLEAAYKKNYRAPFADVPVAKNISKDLAFKLEQMNLDLPQIAVKTKPQRRYVYKEATSAILGYLGEIDKEQLAQLMPYGYRRQDLIGKSGLEKTLDIFLRGEDGGFQIEINNRGYQAGVLGFKSPKAGTDIRLTIDADLQEYAYSLLSPRRGAVVVLNPNDGRVITMVSSPGFDPDIFSSPDVVGDINAILNDPSNPLLNRAVQNQYPPGSIFKVITTTAGLEIKRIKESTTFYCPGFYSLGGRRFGCWKKEGHGRLDLYGALQQSCNVYFFKAGEKIKQEPLTAYAYLFGLGRQTGIDLPGEAKGFIPDKTWKRRAIGENWYQGDTLNFAIGQGYVLITPLQAAVMISAIANNGKLVQPYVVESVGGNSLKKPRFKPLPISASTIKIIQKGLNSVVKSDSGTGILARVAGLSVCGKTGTAQLENQTSHAWFIGYAPSENPKAAIAVFLENGGYGGEQAAPIAGAIFKKMKQSGMM